MFADASELIDSEEDYEGGFEVLFSNLLASHTVELNQDVQELIPVMRQLAKRTDAGSNSSAKPLLSAIWEAEKDKGLVNYAPFERVTGPCLRMCQGVLSRNVSMCHVLECVKNVCVRCRRPRDSETLGLSQIKVWGSTLYGPPDDGSLTGDPLEQMTW
ncbi:predicted protein [Nematostella vectensis]|uniref:Uncharacterized protein n=1 Tax=Nematostella vectensis TaxID=45351 RepID=A7SIE1_NEMVE|nr:predicted protein [Nematostella vectensis]|eukprot:XP_001628580.1 predicted protein [Nematostella vectensis]